ncbi:hypothetical protein [Neodiprion abietis nucleopolyhedrovirus]|uniref:Uncharacterized protein n=1 Tax=Neodiprion abietis nucleopolyhedrovirus TaxID=204507 RepID=Q0ZP61_9CBAC|nr:hypothetical protein [Neodiprion abietis nucleopolyhedrovirus]ABC74893.1 unknown [Neodiprion abietis nucleopolyhedrovirus]
MSTEREERCESLSLEELRTCENPHAITHLKLKHDDSVENTYLPLLGDNLELCLPNLVYLKIFMFVVNMEKISDALQGCPNLQHLDIVVWGESYDSDIGDTSYEVNMDMRNFLQLQTINIFLTEDVWKFTLVSPTIKKLQIRAQTDPDFDCDPKTYIIECTKLEIIYKNDFIPPDLIDHITYWPKKKDIGVFNDIGGTDNMLWNQDMEATDLSYFFLPNLKSVIFPCW